MAERPGSTGTTPLSCPSRAAAAWEGKAPAGGDANEAERAPGAGRCIPVGANWSVAIILAIIADMLAVSVLPAEVRHQAAAIYWTAGCITAVFFLAALLAHGRIVGMVTTADMHQAELSVIDTGTNHWIKALGSDHQGCHPGGICASAVLQQITGNTLRV